MERILQAFSEALRERGPGWWSRCWRAAAADDAGLARKKLESIAREWSRAVCTPLRPKLNRQGWSGGVEEAKSLFFASSFCSCLRFLPGELRGPPSSGLSQEALPRLNKQVRVFKRAASKKSHQQRRQRRRPMACTLFLSPAHTLYLDSSSGRSESIKCPVVFSIRRANSI